MARQRKNGNGNSTATIGFEQKLWVADVALRNNMDAAEYKHVVLGMLADAAVALMYNGMAPTR